MDPNKLYVRVSYRSKSVDTFGRELSGVKLENETQSVVLITTKLHVIYLTVKKG